MNTPTADGLYPPLEPYHHDWLDGGDGHRIYFEQCGNPAGIPVLFIHGGPGSGCTAQQRRLFDPARDRAILFDQRGCGRSMAADLLHANTSAHLLADIERLRVHLNIERWTLLGGSWGAALALAYAKRHPQRVRALLLRGAFLARAEDVALFTRNLRQFLPQHWAALCTALNKSADDEDLIPNIGAHCADVIFNGARAQASAVAQAWLQLEAQAMQLTVANAAEPLLGAPLAARTWIYMHYLRAQFFLRDGELLQDLQALHTIATDIIQGALDPVCPPSGAWALAQRLPQARLHLVAQAGHGGFEPAISRAIVASLAHLQAQP
ncbi:prolyl aminopeptidase [Sinimarinibacterium sp. NLF-5-8]|uniref:prolyl aminopeptidase n=1 Tax=Sinimarinibacterium sp. NLF-5-8 TaxID=2698684 RepID=UPI00137BD41C|nr:prolyl aminopeptidase [Sinimarinibacterium sp. NLF-5-8]QHS11308.1 prolyl aminopeptidase [Sinimarinibacterium sp. NLF-5-8]